LSVLLPTLEKAPDEWQAEAFAVRHPDPPPSDEDDGDSDNAADRAFSPPPPRELAEVLDEELLVALRRGAVRGAVCKLASLLACADRACRGEADSFVPAEERAACVAHAQAMHDMAHALLNGHLGDARAEAAALLTTWCSVADPTTALDGRYDDEASPADKWRAFACEFAETAVMPGRIRRARREILLHNMGELGGMLGGHPTSPLPNQDELEQLGEQNATGWATQLVELLTQGAPA
jgi:hypothetical protein